MVSQREQVDQAILGGLRAGGGDAGGEPGSQSQQHRQGAQCHDDDDDALDAKVAVVSPQVHVVRPVLNRIDSLIQTAANDTQGLFELFSVKNGLNLNGRKSRFSKKNVCFV